jgi:catechol 1,2-dioxygenase
MSNAKRDETMLLCDILGLETLVDEITSKLLARSPTQMTPSAILGPFYRADAPYQANNTSIVHTTHPSWAAQAVADSAFITGRVLSATTGKPLAKATVDVWETAPNGLYEQQDSLQADMNLRGRFMTDAEGRYAFYALRPAPYPIPDDGPAGQLLKMLDRHPFRPGHIHFIVSADRHRALTTQIFDDRDQYLRDDAVFAVKEELVVTFVARAGDSKAPWGLEYDFVLGEI